MSQQHRVPSTALLVLCLGAAGCYGAGADGELDSEAAVERTPKPEVAPDTYDMNRLLEDDQIFGGERITAEAVQDFLEGNGSFLATYAEGDRSAAELIVERSHAHGVSPLYMIARIHTESGLITSPFGDYVEQATGCGCPDGGGCDPDLGGFGAQVECAALLMAEYRDEIETDGVTRAGWAPGVTSWTSDGCSITPANQATAMLYTYTPWVGAYADQDCGTWEFGGSTLVALSYYVHWIAYDWDL